MGRQVGGGRVARLGEVHRPAGHRPAVADGTGAGEVLAPGHGIERARRQPDHRMIGASAGISSPLSKARTARPTGPRTRGRGLAVHRRKALQVGDEVEDVLVRQVLVGRHWHHQQAVAVRRHPLADRPRPGVVVVAAGNAAAAAGQVRRRQHHEDLLSMRSAAEVVAVALGAAREGGDLPAVLDRRQVVRRQLRRRHVEALVQTVARFAQMKTAATTEDDEHGEGAQRTIRMILRRVRFRLPRRGRSFSHEARPSSEL